MRLPSKVTSYKASIVSRFPIILSCLDESSREPLELFNEQKKKFADLSEYCDVLDCLFALRTIAFDEEERLVYVDRNKL